MQETSGGLNGRPALTSPAADPQHCRAREEEGDEAAWLHSVNVTASSLPDNLLTEASVLQIKDRTSVAKVPTYFQLERVRHNESMAV